MAKILQFPDRSFNYAALLAAQLEALQSAHWSAAVDVLEREELTRKFIEGESNERI